MNKQELNKLKWGDRVYTTPAYKKLTTRGKTIESGIFLGFNKTNPKLLQVVSEYASTVYTWHPDYWTLEESSDEQ